MASVIIKLQLNSISRIAGLCSAHAFNLLISLQDILLCQKEAINRVAVWLLDLLSL